MHKPSEAPGPAVRTSMRSAARGQLPPKPPAFLVFPQVTGVCTPRTAEPGGWAFRVVPPGGQGMPPAHGGG
ncbi:hypothetical protein Stube_56620 [Streptomyces tubercidicus]|uniref:Uncharacterized protein n=1 Tax=Streptomyces tubercidicus TaxID=47759 RepID=A0A640UYP0_9ACTN|nr:hypothetical protein Stube_56620 [Streptomyces tubercidicus]